MKTGESALPSVAAIVLAAGGSKRMGQPKQLLPIDGVPMARRVVQAVCLADLAQVVVVVGAEAGAVREALAGLPVEVTANEGWQEGMSGSVRAGLAALRPEIEAALLVLADQPGLTPALLRVIVERYGQSRAAIVVPYFRGQRGNPVLIDRSLFGELSQVDGDRGGRALLVQHEQDLDRLDLDDDAILLDVDTREDYQRLCDRA